MSRKNELICIGLASGVAMGFIAMILWPRIQKMRHSGLILPGAPTVTRTPRLTALDMR